MTKGYWLRCTDCQEPLVAKCKPDGRVETWHRDRPCRAVYPVWQVQIPARPAK